jgi:hypothetical protein
VTVVEVPGMANEKKFTQISPLWTDRGVVLFALDGIGRVWKLVEGQDHWERMPFSRLEESDETVKGRWTSTSRRPMEWLDGLQPGQPGPPLRPVSSSS